MMNRTLLALLPLLVEACAAAPPTAPQSVTVQAAPPPRQPSPLAVPPTRGARLEICRVDDELDPFGQDAGVSDVPDGLTISVESVSVGGDYRAVHFAQAQVLPGESSDAARRRMLRWLDTVSLPSGRRFGLQHHRNEEAFDGSPTEVSWRTYVLVTPCELDDSAVESARVWRDAYGGRLSIELTRAGAHVFSTLTEQMVRRRLALMLDGTVMTAPVVMQQISGGRLDISLGVEDVDLPLQFASGVPIKRD